MFLGSSVRLYASGGRGPVIFTPLISGTLIDSQVIAELKQDFIILKHFKPPQRVITYVASMMFDEH